MINKFDNLINDSGGIFEALQSLPTNIFAPFMQPLNDLFTNTDNIFDTLLNLPQTILNLFEVLLKGLFIPEDDYFPNKFNEVKFALVNKLGYDNYIEIFGDLENIEESNISSISLENYNVGGLNITISNFIDISKISYYRNIWFSWIRGVVFILLIIYNLNQIYKLIRGTNLADGVSTISHMSGGVDK